MKFNKFLFNDTLYIALKISKINDLWYTITKNTDDEKRYNLFWIGWSQREHYKNIKLFGIIVLWFSFKIGINFKKNNGKKQHMVMTMNQSKIANIIETSNNETEVSRIPIKFRLKLYDINDICKKLTIGRSTFLKLRRTRGFPEEVKYGNKLYWKISEIDN